MSNKANKPKKARYPMGLFLMGVLTNLIYRNFWLCVMALFLLIAGFWRTWSLYAGLGLLALGLVIAVNQQVRFRRIAMTSNDPKLKKLQEAILSGDWKTGMQEWAKEQSQNK